MDRCRQLLGMLRRNLGPENKSVIQQLYEMTILQLRGQLSPFQYYDYRLCRRSVRDLKNLDYLGRQTYWQIQHKLNHTDWNPITHNKWLFHVHMTGFGLPVPRAYGYYDRVNGLTAVGDSLRTAEDLRQLLQAMEEPELVIKPLHGGKGADVLVLTRFPGDPPVLQASDGREYSVPELTAFMSKRPFLLQEKVKQHPFMARLNPYTLNTFRIVTFIDRDGEPHVHWAGMRMGRKGSSTDNAHAGGIMVHMEAATGVFDYGGYLDEPATLTAHPDTGVQFAGVAVPFWQEILELSLRAARLCPLGAAGWDIAMSEQGPVIIEVNAKWFYRQPQKLKGYLTPQIREHLAGYGIRQS